MYISYLFFTESLQPTTILSFSTDYWRNILAPTDNLKYHPDLKTSYYEIL